jgi:hypothetical protein
MPIHDWTLVSHGTFHDFHVRWIGHISESLNRGVLPTDYYAQAEQHATDRIADVLTLHVSDPESDDEPDYLSGSSDTPGGIAVAEAPPVAPVRMVSERKTIPRARTRTLTIRHVSGHRVVAILELVSPANKDRPAHVQDFVLKVMNAISNRVHVGLVDLFPATKAAPRGLHGAAWEALGGKKYRAPAVKPLAVASYPAIAPSECYLTPTAVGESVPDLPLYLTPTHYVNVPLGSTYEATFAGTATFWQNVLLGKTPALAR